MTKQNLIQRHAELRRIFLEAAGRKVNAGKVDEAAPTGATAPRFFDRTNAFMLLLWQKQGGLCGVCGEEIHRAMLLDGRSTHVDHIVPYAAGGRTEPGNAQVAHRRCNQSKGQRVQQTGVTRPPPSGYGKESSL